MGGWGGLFTPSQHLVPFSRFHPLIGSPSHHGQQLHVTPSCSVWWVSWTCQIFSWGMGTICQQTEHSHASTLSVNSLSSLRPWAFPFYTWVHLWSLSMMQTLQHPILATLAHFSIPLAVIHTCMGSWTQYFTFHNEIEEQQKLGFQRGIMQNIVRFKYCVSRHPMLVYL